MEKKTCSRDISFRMKAKAMLIDCLYIDTVEPLERKTQKREDSGLGLGAQRKK